MVSATSRLPQVITGRRCVRGPLAWRYANPAGLTLDERVEIRVRLSATSPCGSIAGRLGPDCQRSVEIRCGRSDIPKAAGSSAWLLHTPSSFLGCASMQLAKREGPLNAQFHWEFFANSRHKAERPANKRSSLWCCLLTPWRVRRRVLLHLRYRDCRRPRRGRGAPWLRR
jgi:hypothetical protein